MFSFFCHLVRTLEYLEYNKAVKIASREPNEFIASNGSMTPANAKIFQVLKAGMVL